jgi:hypothetical protein
MVSDLSFQSALLILKHVLLTFFSTDAFILSRSEGDLNEIYQTLMENLYHVTAAIQELDVNLKTNSTPSVHRGDIVDIITTL